MEKGTVKSKYFWEVFFEKFWDNLLKLVGSGFLVTFIVFISMSMFADHKIRSYYLAQDGDRITIYKDIDWQGDETIRLDKIVTYQEALDMLDRLNATLK